MATASSSEPTHRDPRVVARMRVLGRYAALGAGAIAAAVLASWIVGPGWARTAGLPFETQPNAALGLLLAATAAFLCGRGGARARTFARALGLLAAVIGGATLLEHLTGADLWLDRLLYPGPVPSAGSTSPGRMGPPASLVILVAGAAAVALESRPRLGQLLALAVTPLPAFGIVGYAYQVPALYSEPLVTAIAFPTAVALLLVTVAIALARPDVGLMSNLAAAGSGSAIARRMLLYVLALPFALGWIAVASSSAGPSGAFAIAILVVGLTVVLVLLVMREAVALERVELAKARAQAEREASRAELASALRREREARAHAEAASRAKDEFLTTLSHELRTPMNAFLGWSRLLRDAQSDPERLARGLAVLDRNGRALAQVVSDLLDMSRVARGVIQLERVDVDVVAVVEGALDCVRPAADAKGIRLTRRFDERLPRVMGDPARLQQIAWNLISNAVKFTPAGGAVEVRVSSDGGRVALAVEDSGVGIAPEFLPHVFERFRQADGSSTRRHGGLGLGLALTRELVVLHGGSIEAASSGAGRGSTFRVLLPAAEVAPDVPRPAPHGDRPLLGGARILVVDDETDSRELLLQLLASWGARPVGAGSAREALVAAARERPDLLLSDIAMPGEDGCALVQELRRVERALGHEPVPAVALTAFTRPEDRRRVLAAGFDAHVPKPVESDELRRTLAELLRSAAARPVPPRGPGEDREDALGNPAESAVVAG